MSPLRLALIGCGSHSTHAHASPLAHYVQNHPGEVDLVAACDLDIERADRFCWQFGFATAYSDIEAMLQAAQPDAVVSILPIPKTCEVGKMLLQRGIPCVLEKPPGATLEEASSLAEIARQTGTPHLVSMNRRFNPYLNRAIKWAKQCGPLRTIRAQMYRQGRIEPDFLWGTGIHVVDAMRHIGGELAAFDLQSQVTSSSSTSWFLISMQFASGSLGQIEILPTCGMVEERFELFGDEYRASVVTTGGDGESVRCWRQGAIEIEEVADSNAPLYLRDGSYEETSAFIRGIRESTPLYPTLEDVLPSLQVCG